MYLLDTNVCIQILNGTSRNAINRFTSESPSRLRLCSVVKAELLFGARKSKLVAENMGNLSRFFVPMLSLPFDDSCSEHYGNLRADLEKSGTPIGANDLMIASIARQHDLIVVTNNVSEFTRVVGLRVEDWEAST